MDNIVFTFIKKSKIFRSIAAVIIFSIIYFTIQYMIPHFIPPEITNSNSINIFNSIFDAIFISILVTLFYSVPEKMGITLNIKEEISSQITVIQDKVGSMLFSKIEYGLSGIDQSFDENDLLDGLMAGDKIMWLNTRLNDLDLYKTSILNAANRGVTINVLLMSSSSHTAKYRWKEAFSNEEQDNYERRLRVQEGAVEGLLAEFEAQRRQSDESKQNDAIGSLEIKFYEGLPCVPMIIIKKKNDHKAAYTGYYLNQPSGNTPYIEWQTSPRNPMVNKFENYFKAKWDGLDEEADPETMARQT